MANCRKCNKVIADGKNYCHSCWDIVWDEYLDQKNNYEQELNEWNSLSSTQKMQIHASAEKRQLENYTFAPFLITTILIAIYRFVEGDLFSNYKMLILIISIFIIGLVIKRFLSVILGRIIRGIVLSVVSGGILGIVGGIIGYFYKDPKTIATFQNVIESVGIKYKVESNIMVFSSIFIIIGIVIGVIKEIRGSHHASGAPRIPSQPRP